MPGPYEVLNARVKQKINTEDQWIAEENDFGVIFEGEQAFVYDDAGLPVNFKIGDGTKKFSELPYFIAYMSGVANQKVLAYIDQTANITINSTFRNKSFIQQVILLNNSGADVTIKIGITDGGSEIAEIVLPDGPTSLEVDYFFSTTQNVFITGLTGVSFSLFLLYLQLDESPVAPMPSGGSAASFVFGVLYDFYPMYMGHTEAYWNFTTGRGKAGRPVEGCIVMGTNLLDTMEGYHRVGAGSSNLGTNVGSDTLTIIQDNLPAVSLKMFAAFINSNAMENVTEDSYAARAKNTTGGNTLNYQINSSPTAPTLGKTSELGIGTAMVNKPKAKAVLVFTGPNTTT